MKFRISVFIPIIDCLLSNLRKRKEAYSDFGKRFSFLSNLFEVNKDHSATASILTEIFPEDFSDERELKEEIGNFNYIVVSNKEDVLQFAHKCNMAKKEKKDLDFPKSVTIRELYKWFIDLKLDAIYPNMNLIFKICLCMPATNCSAERSFSKLKRIKDYVRNTTEQDRLDALAVLCVESEITVSLNYDSIIQNFADMKVRKKNFKCYFMFLLLLLRFILACFTSNLSM